MDKEAVERAHSITYFYIVLYFAVWFVLSYRDGSETENFPRCVPLYGRPSPAGECRFARKRIGKDPFGESGRRPVA